jgi:LAO/AO transport system kinase
MVDTFLLLTLARTGDQLQGIKKGVLELADVIAVNKADGPHATDAARAARELSSALRLLRPPEDAWQPPVLTCSGLDGDGIDTVWRQVERHHEWLAASGDLDRRRGAQQVAWMWSTIRARLIDQLRHHREVATLAPDLETQVRDGTLTPSAAADRILGAFGR